MEADQELKSLKRGLKALLLLNLRGSLTISGLSRSLELPRTTAERILMTLLSEGFVERDTQTKRYFLTSRVRGLTNGFSEQSTIVHCAAPLLRSTTKEIGWPLCLAIPNGEYMSVRYTTDPDTSLNLNRRHIGSEIGMAISSSGLVHLAFIEAKQREIMLGLLRKSEDPQQAISRDIDRMTYAIELAQVKGYSFGFDRGHERSISLPIIDKNRRIKAVLLMAYISRALTEDAVVRDFLPRLRTLVADIERLAFDGDAAN